MKKELLLLGIAILILSIVFVNINWVQYVFGEVAENSIDKIHPIDTDEEGIHAKKASENVIGLHRKCVELISGHNDINANKINVVFVGINLGIDELLNHSVASVDYYGTKNGLMAIEPFKSNKNNFNFFYVNEIGFVDTSLLSKGSKGIEANPEINRLSKYCDLNDIYPIAFINSTIASNADYGGNIRTSYFDTPRPNIVVHEFGHSFGLLLDERGESKVTLKDSSAQYGNCYYSSKVNCTKTEECSDSGKCRELTTCRETNESLSECRSNSMWLDLLGSGCGKDGTFDCPLEYVTVIEEKCEQEGDDYTCYNNAEKALKNLDANNEIDCYLGCNSMNSYRSTFSNVMISSGSYFSFGPSNERVLCGKIQKIIGSAEGICKDLCGDDCIDYDLAPTPATPISELKPATKLI